MCGDGRVRRVTVPLPLPSVHLRGRRVSSCGLGHSSQQPGARGRESQAWAGSWPQKQCEGSQRALGRRGAVRPLLQVPKRWDQSLSAGEDAGSSPEEMVFGSLVYHTRNGGVDPKKYTRPRSEQTRLSQFRGQRHVPDVHSPCRAFKGESLREPVPSRDDRPGRVHRLSEMGPDPPAAPSRSSLPGSGAARAPRWSQVRPGRQPVGLTGRCSLSCADAAEHDAETGRRTPASRPPG